MAEIIIHIAAVGVGQFKFHIRQRLFCDGIQFPDDQIPSLFVVKAEDIGTVIADFDALGLAVQHHAIGDLDLPHVDGGSRLHPGDDHPAILAGDELAVAVADDRTTAVRNQKGHALQRLVAALGLQVLLDDQGVLGGVVEVGVLNVIRVDHNGLAPSLRVDGVAWDGGLFGNDHSAHDPVDGDGPIRPGVIDAIGRNLPVFIVHHTAGGVGHLELHSGQGGLAVQAAVLVDHQRAQRLVEQLDIVGAGTLDLDGLGGIVQQKSGFAFYFLHDIAARLHGNFDETVLRCAELAIGLADHGAIRPGDTDHHVTQRLLGGAAHFLDDQIPHRLVVKVDALVVVRVDHNGLALAVFVDEVAGNTGNFGEYQRSCYTRNADLPLGIRIIDTVTGQFSANVIHDFTIRKGNLEAYALQGSLAVHAAEFVQRDGTLGLVAELQSHRLASLDGGRLGHIVQNIIWPAAGLARHDSRSGVDIGDQDGPGAVRGVLAVGVA